MYYPNSLNKDILARSFHASNGEIGILLSDVDAFLEACLQENITVLGWEAWLSNFQASCDNAPIPSIGSFCGLIPIKNSKISGIFCGETTSKNKFESLDDFVAYSISKTSEQIKKVNFSEEIDSNYLHAIRINFTIEKEEWEEIRKRQELEELEKKE